MKIDVRKACKEIRQLRGEHRAIAFHKVPLAGNCTAYAACEGGDYTVIWVVIVKRSAKETGCEHEARHTAAYRKRE